MKIVSTLAELREARGAAEGSVGFVPTMGFLHEGHLELVRRARAENDVVVVSIFVNPTQFGPSEDFTQYPRDMDRDLALCEREGTDLVFTPGVKEIYPPGCDTWVDVGTVTGPLEGAARPGHFRGVATVVAKLFNMVQPHKSYFGQKDAQQVLVIQKMVADLDMNLKVIVVPTVREPDGLAMSSRNTYLNIDERQAALVLWNSLQLAQKLYAQGQRDANILRQQLRDMISSEPLARIEYVSVANSGTLEEAKMIEACALVSLAVRIGKTRLIDNVLLEDSGS
jgi:pantoate--beta-alanine ligase